MWNLGEILTNHVAQIILIFVECCSETALAPEMTQHDPMAEGCRWLGLASGMPNCY